IAVNILGTAYEKDQIKSDILVQLNDYLGPNTVRQAEIILENANMEYSGILPQIIGWVVLLFSATTVFISLQNGINKIWGVKPKPGVGFMKLLFDRVLSFAMIVSIGFVMLVSLVIDSLLTLLQGLVEKFIGLEGFSLVWLVNGLLSILATSAIFALVFKVLPDVNIKWKNVLPGALFTAVLFLLGKYLIGFYISTSDVGNAYGASGSLVVFLSWVYYSSILVLFGAKFTYEYTNIMEHHLKPKEHAVFVAEAIIDKDEIETH
nr:YihY/virulence factor BrkB family protein [Saprospiraceae bacterium]